MRVLARGPLRLASHFWNERWLRGRASRRGPSTLQFRPNRPVDPFPCPIQRQFLRLFRRGMQQPRIPSERSRLPFARRQVDGQRIARRGDPDSAWRLALTLEVLIPCPQKSLLMRLDQPCRRFISRRRKPLPPWKRNRVQPELRGRIVPFDVHVWRLSAIVRIEVEAIGPNPQHSWHVAVDPSLSDSPPIFRALAAGDMRRAQPGRFIAVLADVIASAGSRRDHALPVRHRAPCGARR